MRRRVLETLGVDHYLLRSIDSALSSCDSDRGQLVLDAINGQPEAIWEKLMNGWKKPFWRPEAKELVPHPEALDVELVVAVTAQHFDETSSGVELEALSDFVLRRAATPVRIEILEGTGKETSLDLVRAALDKLEQDWDHLTTQPPRYIADKLRAMLQEDELPPF